MKKVPILSRIFGNVLFRMIDGKQGKYSLGNKVDTTDRCEALKEVYVFEMFNIKTFLYQTPPYQRAQIFQIF